MSERTYSSAEVCEMLGITYRQLDFWTRRGWVSASFVSDKGGLRQRPAASPLPGSGVSRRWSEADVARVKEVRDAVAKAVAILVEAGVRVTHYGLANIGRAS